ncbi:RPL7B [Acrasis kona]|uniref:RPL7B n=1 Tax=Acrasis kona TaxID=1008807 RepID=A0AAW2ZMM3_9EUKA
MRLLDEIEELTTPKTSPYHYHPSQTSVDYHFDESESDYESITDGGRDQTSSITNLVHEREVDVSRNSDWSFEKKKFTDAIKKKDAELDDYIKEINEASAELSRVKREIEMKDKSYKRDKEDKDQLERLMIEMEKKFKPVEQELLSARSQEQKANAIAVSLGKHVSSLQQTIDSLKAERERTINNELLLQSSVLDSLIKNENRLLRTFLDQMKKEMTNRKVILDEELLRLKKLVVEALDKELLPFASISNTNGAGTDRIISDQDISNQKAAENVIQEFEQELSMTQLYVPLDHGDPIDVASIRCPVHMDVERLSEGEYLVDKRLEVKLVNGHPIVKSENCSLKDYMLRLYAPFMLVDTIVMDDDMVDQHYEKQEEPTRQSDSPVRVAARQASSPQFSRPSNRSQSPAALNSPRRLPQTTTQLYPVQQQQQQQQQQPIQHVPTLESKHISPSRSQSTPTRHLSPSLRRAEVLPPQKETRYTSILHAAASKNQLKPMRPVQPARKPPVNSSANDRRSGTPPPGPMDVRKQHGSVNSSFNSTSSNSSANNSRNTSPARKALTPSKQTKSSNQIQSSGRNQKSKTLLDGINLNDPQQIAELKRRAFNQTVAQQKK